MAESLTITVEGCDSDHCTRLATNFTDSGNWCDPCMVRVRDAARLRAERDRYKAALERMVNGGYFPRDGALLLKIARRALSETPAEG